MIPVEVVSLILSYLNAPDIFAASSVCKNWRDAATNHLIVSFDFSAIRHFSSFFPKKMKKKLIMTRKKTDGGKSINIGQNKKNNNRLRNRHGENETDLRKLLRIADSRKHLQELLQQQSQRHHHHHHHHQQQQQQQQQAEDGASASFIDTVWWVPRKPNALEAVVAAAAAERQQFASSSHQPSNSSSAIAGKSTANLQQGFRKNNFSNVKLDASSYQGPQAATLPILVELLLQVHVPSVSTRKEAGWSPLPPRSPKTRNLLFFLSSSSSSSSYT